MTEAIKAKVAKVTKPQKRMSRGARYPWIVYRIDAADGCHKVIDEFETEEEGELWMDKSPRSGDVLVHVEIPAVEY